MSPHDAFVWTPATVFWFSCLVLAVWGFVLTERHREEE